ncbi:ABC transporter ATP-binding protein [Vibrio penaeicida]|uniref:ABC transporter ATP-binding protein n=1 Tax=Vibrio penaeicida TaxID=104609 RepID=A0AAV5NXI8_9VIBR|nr:ABC transporter ATP-binding protein [Vibrio penaeicida]RTZ21465.1 ABC transporter ATP-binding protein [Vibrio penaeicida]GLQ75155.1 ABC transporter ATP-binding protein [Vibrio penaeicida]
MSNSVLSLTGLSKSFGALKATQNVSLDLAPNEIHALIGPNGAGKSTLIKQIAGELQPDEGTIHFLGQDITALGVVERARMGLGRSFQISSIVPEFTVMENILLALKGREHVCFQFFTHWKSDRQLNEQAVEFAEKTKLHHRLSVPAAELAHGERRRLELSMALALKPQVFLLDEPMAGLGSEGASEMTELLSELKFDAPILLVEHDMDAVFALADSISVLVYGEVIARGSVDEIRSHPDVRRAYLGEESAEKGA